MEDLLLEVLNSFGFPVFLQGSLGEDKQYSDEFFTYWENTSYDGSHYDNDAVNYIHDYDVNFYSIHPENPYKYIKDAKKLLKEKGFILSGTGYSIASDEVSHTGRGIQAIYLEREV